MYSALTCKRCRGDLETDDAISIIEGICGWCRRGQLRPTKHVAVDLPLDEEETPAPKKLEPQRIQRVPSAAVARPKAPAGPSAPSPTPTRRSRDLIIGVAAGLMILAGLTGYFLRNTIKSASVNDAPVAVARLPMTLTVAPPHAQVLLDDQPIGPADAEGRLSFSLPADADASHWLEIHADGYNDVRRPVSIQGGTDEVHVVLIRQPYEIAVRTEPAGAEVWLDDSLKGYSPLTLSSAATYTGQLTLKRAGYADIRRDVAPPIDGGKLDINVALESMGPLVRVDCSPAGAEVVVGGRVVGTAPGLIQLDKSQWGRLVKIQTRMAGFESAVMEFEAPTTPDDVGSIRFALRPEDIALNINTNPPGARVVADGIPLGESPVTARFPADRTGTRIKVEAMQPGLRYGAAIFSLPEPGKVTKLDVPMALTSRRVVFGWNAGADSFTLTDRLLDEIHRLDPAQQFVIVAWSDDGPTVWPTDNQFAAASSEQKVRAYDYVRSLRGGESVEPARLYASASALEPDAVWLFLPGSARLDGLRNLGDQIRAKSVNVVTTALHTDDAWANAWAAEHHGMLEVVPCVAPGMSSALAGQPGAAD